MSFEDKSCMVIGHCPAMAVHAVLFVCIYLAAFLTLLHSVHCTAAQGNAIHHLSGSCKRCSVFLRKSNGMDAKELT